MGNKHALLSASGASRWMNCPPSPRIEEKFKTTESSVYAQEGTLAHEWAESKLKFLTGMISKRTYNNHTKKYKENELYTTEMPDQVDKYTTYVYDSFKTKGIESVLEIEVKTDLSDYIKEGFGTCDSVVIADGEMEIIDLKYGKGVKVSADKNPQLMLYALGAYRSYEMMYDIKSVKLTIVQPRLDSISSWIISIKDLILFGETEVKPIAELAYEGKGIQKAGTWCRWCKAKAKCATLASFSMSAAKDEFSDPHLLKDSQLLDIYNKIPIITDWIKSVNEHMLSEALTGKKWKGLKLVEGRSNRKWSDSDEVISILQKDGNYTDDEFMDSKLKGIIAIDKLLGNDFDKTLGKYVIKPQGKPTLVPVEDKRQEFNNPKNDFK